MLAPLGGEPPDAPAWFKSVLAHEPERGFVPVDGADIETLSWGKRGNPGLLLLHGQGACADWWSFIAPFFADRYRVTAFSWSGMGRSDWRDVYDFEILSQEIMTVAETCGQFESACLPVVAAHSYGGIILMYAARELGRRIGGAITIDCFFKPDGVPSNHKSPPNVRSMRRYPTLAEALARFRLEPSQGCENLFVLDYVARQSLVYLDAEGDKPAGWTWRFDPAVRLKTKRIGIAPYLASMSCPLVMMWGANSSLMTPPVQEYMLGTAPKGTPWVSIPNAAHHVLLDQPLALAAAINGVLVVWPKR